MHYLGFDCHKNQQAWTLRGADGQVVARGEVPNERAALRQLRAGLPPELTVGLEGPRNLRREVERQFADCSCFEISPAWTHALRERSPLPDKDDARDADRVAEALFRYREQLTPRELSNERAEALAALVSVYAHTVRQLTAVRNRVHHFLTLLWQASYQKAFPHGLTITARRFFSAYPHPARAQHARGLADRLRRWSHGRLGQPTALQIKALVRDAPPPTAAQRVWSEELREALAEYDRLADKHAGLRTQMQTLLEEMECRWLLAEPGLGPVHAAQLVAGGLLASPGPSPFARHCGIAPESDSTGGRRRHRNAWRRHQTLFQTMMSWAAWHLGPHAPDPHAATYYARKLREGKSGRTALRCLARRQIERLFALRARQCARAVEFPPPSRDLPATTQPSLRVSTGTTPGRGEDRAAGQTLVCLTRPPRAVERPPLSALTLPGDTRPLTLPQHDHAPT